MLSFLDTFADLRQIKISFVKITIKNIKILITQKIAGREQKKENERKGEAKRNKREK